MTETKTLYVVEFYGSKGWEWQYMGIVEKEAQRQLNYLRMDKVTCRLTVEYKEVG